MSSRSHEERELAVGSFSGAGSNYVLGTRNGWIMMVSDTSTCPCSGQNLPAARTIAGAKQEAATTSTTRCDVLVAEAKWTTSDCVARTQPALLRHADALCARARATEIVVYRLYGHYSFNPRDGGEQVTLVLADGYSVGQWFDGAKMIVGPRFAVSVEQALYHGYARIAGRRSR
jgi:hypothetical protein